jgi:glucosamine kinase
VANQVYIGIDGGGTYSRVVCATLDGIVLAYAEGGGANPDHNVDSEANLRRTVADALTRAGQSASSVAGTVAGLAGLDAPDDREWADRYAATDGSRGPRLAVNDTEIALAGALELQPGILSIASTGTNTFGRTDDGRLVGNYTHFGHYAHMAARHLTYGAVFAIVAGDAVVADQTLVDRALAHWGVADIVGLREVALSFASQEPVARNKRASSLAPAITQAALDGSPIARRACEAAVEEQVVAIRLVASCFAARSVQVVLHGAVANCPYINAQLRRRLSACSGKELIVASPSLPPAHGAVLMAAERWGRVPLETIVRNLKASG